MSQSDDELEKPAEKQINLRLDPEHYAALKRVAGFEKLNGPETLRKLIRIADQAVMGVDSPFASRLEHLLQRKAG